MKNPIPLLDEYQVPLLDDKEAFAVIAFLLREGTSTDDEISRATDLPTSVVQSVKRRLFRGRLVRLRDLGKVSLTDTSAELLVRLGLTRVMIDSIVSEKMVSSQLATKWNDILKELVASDQVPVRKQLRFRVAQYLARALAEDAGEACRFLAASAVGMQEDTTSLPWELLGDSTRLARPELTVRQGAGDMTMNVWHVAHHGADALRMALSDLDATKLALDKELAFPNDEHQRRTVEFVILDACASAMTQLDAPSRFLRFACDKDRSLPTRLWDLWMRENVGGILRDAVNRFQSEYLFIDLDFSKRSVPDVLGSVLMAQSGTANARIDSWWERVLSQPAQSPAIFELALARASELRKFIESDAFRSLPDAEQRRLQVEVQEISNELATQMTRSRQPERESIDTSSEQQLFRPGKLQ